MPDDPDYVIPESKLIKSLNFIDYALRKANSKILVHCHAGVSRSATFAIAYMIKYKGFKLQEALKQVQTYRPQCLPNRGFM